MRVIIYIVMFLLIGAFFIVSNENLHLSEKVELNKFFGAYFSWMGDLLVNGKSITGYVVNFRWMPETNQTQP